MLEELGLGGNRIGSASCDAIASRLFGNNIGNAGCEAIVALLTVPNCNLHTLYTEGATVIANSLINNNKLHTLYLDNNRIDQSVEDVFYNILCNKTNTNETYASKCNDKFRA